MLRIKSQEGDYFSLLYINSAIPKKVMKNWRKIAQKKG